MSCMTITTLMRMLPLISKWRIASQIHRVAIPVRRKWKCALVWANGKMTPSTQRKAGVAWAQPSRLAPMWLVRVRDSQSIPWSLIFDLIWKISKAKILGGWWCDFWNIGKQNGEMGGTQGLVEFSKGTVWFLMSLICFAGRNRNPTGKVVRFRVRSSLMYAHLRWSLRGRQELNDTLVNSNF